MAVLLSLRPELLGAELVMGNAVTVKNQWALTNSRRCYCAMPPISVAYLAPYDYQNAPGLRR